MEPLDIQSAWLDEHGDVHVTISGYKFVAQRNIKVLEELLDKGWAAYFPKDDVPPEWLNAYREAPPSHVGNANLDTNKLLLTSHPVLVAIALVDFLDLLDNGDKSSNAVPIPTFNEAVRDIRARRITNPDNTAYRSKVPGVLRWNRDGTRIWPLTDQPCYFDIELSEPEEEQSCNAIVSHDESDPFALSNLLLPVDKIDSGSLQAGFAINDDGSTDLILTNPKMYLIPRHNQISIDFIDLDATLISVPATAKEIEINDYFLLDAGLPDGGMNLWRVIDHLENDGNSKDCKLMALLVAAKPSLVCKLKGTYSSEVVDSQSDIKRIKNPAHVENIVDLFLYHDSALYGLNIAPNIWEESANAISVYQDANRCLIGLRTFLLNCENENNLTVPGCLFVDQGCQLTEEIDDTNYIFNFQLCNKPYIATGDFFVKNVSEISNGYSLFTVLSAVSGFDACEYELNCKLITSIPSSSISYLFDGNLIPCSPDIRLAYLADDVVKTKVLRCFSGKDSNDFEDEEFYDKEFGYYQGLKSCVNSLEFVQPRIFLLKGEIQEINRVSFEDRAVVPFNVTRIQEGDFVLVEHVSNGSIFGLWNIISVRVESLEEQTCRIHYGCQRWIFEIPRNLIDGRFEYIDSAETCAIVSDPVAAAQIIEFCNQAEIDENISEFRDDIDEMNRQNGSN